MPAQSDLDVPRLSGVGIHREDNGMTMDPLIVPSYYHSRWDDMDASDADKLQLMQHGSYNYSGYAFILHANCCFLLGEYFHPQPIPIARLAEVCKSCPLQYAGGSGRILNWGHDYGGGVALDNLCPWEEQDFYSDQDYEAINLELPYGEEDPCRILDPGKLIHEATQTRQNLRTWRSSVALGAKPNCFTGLPYEILETIVVFLPTHDVRTFAQTSRWLKRIIPSRLGQTFWASRFNLEFEFDFIFEARKHRGHLDWKWLYFEISNTLHNSKGLQNRRRIWRLIQSPLSELLSLHWMDNQSPSSQDTKALRWKEVPGQFFERKELDSEFGCLRFYQQSASIPTTLYQVIISSISIRNISYITGIQFITYQGQRVCLGYKGQERQSVNLIDQSTYITGIQGFIVAVASKGISALRLITDRGQLSQWFGSPEGLPKTRRLSTYKSIIALEAGFDVRYAPPLYLFFITPILLINYNRDLK